MAWLSRIWNTLHQNRLQRALDEELRLHLELSARDLRGSGMPERAAHTEAALRLGNLTLQTERTREMDIANGLETVAKDLQYAARQLIRNPVFTIVAVASLALGIGANTAVFSILNAVLLRSLPVQDPKQLVILTNPQASGAATGSSSGVRALMTYAEYTGLRNRLTAPVAPLAGLCASGSGLNHWSLRVSGGEQESAFGRLVTEDYFSVLGVQPLIGRVFTQPDASDIGSDPYAVISYDYWQHRFGGRTDVLGTHVRLYNAALTIIGVTRPGFRGETGGERPDIWVPMMMEPLVKPGRDWIHEDLSKSIDKVMWLHVFGRLKPGRTASQVQTEANAIFKQLLEDGYPRTLSPAVRKGLLNQRLRVQAARTGAFGGRDQLSQELLVLLIVAGLVLLIACANVANLLLARSTARYQEVGVRLSLGAGKRRLIRQFMTESALLSFVGAAAGVLLSLIATKALSLAFVAQNEELQLSTPFDWTVLGFTLLVTAFTGLLFGLAPAFRATRANIIDSAKESGRGITGSTKRMTLAKTLVSAQVAISLLLVAGAGLFLRTLWNLESVNVGFVKEHLLVVRIDAITAGYNDTSRTLLYANLADRLSRSLPGVRAVTYSENGLLGGTDSGDPVDVEGFVHRSDNDAGARFDQLGPHYFSTLGVPILLGREIDDQDTSASARVCVINEAFAKRFFLGRNPIGKHVTDTYGGGKLTMQVVGLARDVRDHRLRDLDPRFYVSIAQNIDGVPPSVYFEVRTVGDSSRALAAVRNTIMHVNANLPILTAHTVDELIDTANNQPRIIARLCGVFAAIAMLLAATGLYGVLSYMVARRTNEIGIRMALGAGRRNVTAMILQETAWIVAVGLTMGVAATCASTPIIASRLYGLSAIDPVTIAAAIAILAIVSMLAGYVPAARAARLSPMTALRHQ